MPKKPKRVKCPACGREYDEGAPHEMFCRGTDEITCELCGEDHGDVFKCNECGTPCCPNCGDPEEQICGTCMDMINA